ncbi:MAG: DNA-directed RNA polymerase subunit beta [Actinobacteria bacterium]|nr:DNA-directed RNA polymerase subunit beta [Actinomycetota bacterium]
MRHLQEARLSSTALRERRTFAKLAEVLPPPNLISIQKESFDWFLNKGLGETLGEISPIEDFTGNLALQFLSHRFEEPKFDEDECKEKDMTFSRPLFVTCAFINKETGEIKEQTVFMGDFPMMTAKGTFIINGTERVVVSQLVRSPGVYFDHSVDKTSDKDVYGCKIIPARGAWLEFETDKKDMVAVRIDRKRKQNVTVLLKALGYGEDQQILDLFDGAESIRSTLEKDAIQSEEDALIDIYRKLRPGEPPTVESARTLLENLFFNAKRYDLARVGRYKVNKKLGFPNDEDTIQEMGTVLRKDDILETIRYIVKLHAGDPDYGTDDIDHFGNRRIRPVGELIQNQIRVGLSRMERVVRERMTTQDVEAITPQTLINIRPVVASIKEFFGSSQLSQFMDQTNPLAGLTHKRRLSALGPGGLSRERAGFEVRDVHSSHYGRMCPIETPEGPNIGLIGSLSTYARLNRYGFIETPYRIAKNGKVTEEVAYLTADEEDRAIVAQANVELDSKGKFLDEKVLVRGRQNEVDYVDPHEVDYMDVSPKQIVSVAAACIPFLEHDDANRALMGANMQRQAVPLLRPQAPYVGTGLEFRAAVDAGDVVIAPHDGTIEEVTADHIVLTKGSERTLLKLDKFRRSNQSTCINQRPIVKEGQKVKAEEILADGPSTDSGELALGANLCVAFMSWEGYNFEDAIILSERLVKEDILTSIHIEEYEVDARDTKLGAEEITRDIPNVSEDVLADLDERGIIRVGAEVGPGDVLVGKVTPKGETELTPEERLLRAIFGEKAREVRDTSLKMPHGEEGKVIGVREFSRDAGDELAPGVNELVRVFVAQKRKISEFDGAKEDEILGALESVSKRKTEYPLTNAVGKAQLFDGRSGEPYDNEITVGYMYILKLSHMVDDKIHARSTGPYSMITQQPLGGKAQFGGQRFGEMEVWALEAYGAAYCLQELLTIKSDDVLGRVKVYEAIVKGENIPEPGIPESFKVLIKEMQSLCLNVEVLSSTGEEIEMKEIDEDIFRTAEELGIDLSRREPSSVEEV